MKVVVTGLRGFPGVQGGVEKHCERLYTHLIPHKCDITVFTRTPYVRPEIKEYNGIKLIPVGCPKSKYLEAIAHTFRCILMARKLRPDILHIHAIGPSVFAPLAKIMGMKVVVTHHGPDYKRKKWPLPAKIFLAFCEMVGVKFADKVIAIAGNIADDLRKRYGVDPVVIPNGVDIPVPAETAEVLRKFGLTRRRYILAVGRFVPEKGFDYLIEAFNRLQDLGEGKSLEGWRLVIVGDADHEDRYSLGLKRKALNSKNVVLTGFQTGQGLNELYSHAGLFVLPSFYEGLPIVLLEAMSYGLSCIASDIPANRNIHLATERFFKAGDVSDLALKLKEFTQRPWGSDEGRRQVRKIAEEYSWAKIAFETLKVYRGIAG